jgi:hypothetical protein
MGQIFDDFAKINDYLIVGSHPRDAADIRKLYDDNHVRAIENLQQITETDKGDINGITDQCVQSGTPIWYQHIPIRDQDRSSVRDNLPVAVAILDKAMTEKTKKPGETVYLHCCEGLGRSPTVAVAYLYWFRGMTLKGACNLLTTERHGCTPYVDAIGGATYDILRRNKGPDNFLNSDPQAFENILADDKGTIQDRVRQLQE